ncbi:hypothetical protein NEOLI_001312 [Neolecta irregularis DAH-3]|uniref:Uncharacterized protein n=1 Tax=Neolecta irregularis (strain DAH-3) TaxID=1198029 RepID=A0A1U7LKY5_NEOID|nr:hypothetical protein NEOLI_001312 [Neolecta irregularis DAH-3]|eukprot:OLL23202.1 hypothetical protein NEOLI_001312 [Neolecta irregularis DAH-3]
MADTEVNPLTGLTTVTPVHISLTDATSTTIVSTDEASSSVPCTFQTACDTASRLSLGRTMRITASYTTTHLVQAGKGGLVSNVVVSKDQVAEGTRISNKTIRLMEILEGARQEE